MQQWRAGNRSIDPRRWRAGHGQLHSGESRLDGLAHRLRHRSAATDAAPGRHRPPGRDESDSVAVVAAVRLDGTPVVEAFDSSNGKRLWNVRLPGDKKSVSAGGCVSCARRSATLRKFTSWSKAL